MTEYYNLFTKIMVDIQENYSYLKFKNYKPLELIKQYENYFKKITDEKDFVKTLNNILALFKDPHIEMLYETKAGKKSNFMTCGKKSEKNYNYKILKKKYLEGRILFDSNEGVIAFYNNILYINIFSWQGRKKKEINKLLDAFKELVYEKKPKNIIVDIRSNAGGTDNLSGQFLSFFIPNSEKIFVCKYQYRIDKNNFNVVGNEKIRYQQSNNSSINSKIIVLIGQECMSSNEYLIIGFEALKNYFNKNNETNRLILIGDNTFGSSGNPQEFNYLDGRLKLVIPSWICYTSEGKLLEGNGVEPDVHINAKKSIGWGKDRVFEKALKIIESFEKP